MHDLSDPATEHALAEAEVALGRPLLAAWRDFLGQWNGGYLFHDDYRLYGVEGARDELRRIALVADEEAPADATTRTLWALGEGPEGELLLDEAGRVLVRDAESGALRMEGSDLERWLDATMAREAVVYDREGEFRDEAFDEGELAAAARRKRAQVALKADPDSPTWNEETGQLLRESGEVERAEAALRRAVELWPGAESAWFSLGTLRRETGDGAEAARCYARSAELRTDSDEAAFAWAQAARAAVMDEALREAARDYAARAARCAPAFVEQQRTAAAHLLEEGALDEAIEHYDLAAAVATDDEDLRRERARARVRRAMRPIE